MYRSCVYGFEKTAPKESGGSKSPKHPVMTENRRDVNKSHKVSAVAQGEGKR